MADSVSLRLTCGEEDLDWLSALAMDPLVEPFLASGRGEPAALRELVPPPASDEKLYGLHLIESARGERLGGLALMPASRISSICEVTRVMVRPDVRRTGVALAAVRLVSRLALLDHGLHRIETQVYSDNLAGQRLFERAGFTREGMRRRAYWRRQRWLDGILYGLLAEEL
ncbi:MAG: GNAT N-acetyltransferase [Solirubrobacterales bacterium]|nr:GNAT N-acetyltransferase [Solirubrobacterales bacterium]MBV9534562.1 GNAT N-acetyltransferase [Solirubrobacterales bacterium]